jgi:nuclear pore complex protein Nup155
MLALAQLLETSRRLGRFVACGFSPNAKLKNPFQAEQVSVQQLQSLLSRTIEAISFFLLLNDYRLGELIAK